MIIFAKGGKTTADIIYWGELVSWPVKRAITTKINLKMTEPIKTNIIVITALPL